MNTLFSHGFPSFPLRTKALLPCLCSTLIPLAFAQEAVPPDGSDPATELDAVLVSGQREADRRAIDEKRHADGITEAISADDVGSLPDENVAEAVSRLPGVTTVNDQGEGRYLTVRGVAPNLLNVTLDGQSAPAPEPDGRQVKLDDIPSSLIDGVSVAKTITPDLDANAIAGQVNIKTLSAFDRKRPFATVRAAYGYHDIDGENQYKVDGSLGGVFGANKQFGAVIALNRSDRRIGAQNMQNPGNWIQVNDQWVPEGLDVRQYRTHRVRTGAVANFDWRPKESAHMFLRLLYSRYQDIEERDQFSIEFDDKRITPDSAQSGSFTRADAIRGFRIREETSHTLSGSTGGIFKFGDNTLTIEGTWSRAGKRDPQRDRWGFLAKRIAGTYQLDPRSYNVTFADDAAFTPANFAADYFRPERRRAREELRQAHADYLIPFGSNGSDLQFGVKYTRREKTNNKDENRWEYAGGPLTLDDVLGGTIDAVMGGRYRLGPQVNGRLADAYLGTNPGEFSLNDTATVAASLGSDYAVNENIAAAYVMSRWHMGDVTLIPGVRVEQTRGRYAAHAFDRTSSRIDQPFNRFGSRRYTDVFPGINLRWNATDAVVLRAALTRAIGRPDYPSLAPFIDVRNSSSRNPRVTMGNPDLGPLYANNADLALEYYAGNRGILALALFYKDISDPIYELTRSDQTVDFNGVELTNARVTSWINARKARVSGVEFNAQYELGFLPAPLDGLGVGMNASFVDSKAEGMPVRTDKIPLLNQSDRVVSAFISYEKARFSAKLGFSYRSPMLTTVHETDPEGDIYWDTLKQWDLKLNYDLTRSWSLFVEGYNLNDAPMRAYQGRRERTLEIESYGWSARFGVKYKFRGAK